MLLLALLVMNMHTTCMNCPRPHPACAVLSEHCAKVMEVQRQISLVDIDQLPFTDSDIWYIQSMKVRVKNNDEPVKVTNVIMV